MIREVWKRKYDTNTHYINKELCLSDTIRHKKCKKALSSKFVTISDITIAKLREREGQRVDLGRSLKGHLWMMDGGWWYTFP